MISWVRTVDPTLTVLTVEDAKEHCRISHDHEDPLINEWIRAATAWVERYTVRALLTQSYRIVSAGWPSSLELPYACPLQSITSVKYYDAANVQQTLASSEYLAITSFLPGRLEWSTSVTYPGSYLRPDAVEVIYVAGYTDAALVPAPLVQAVRMLVGHWHANREAAIVSAISKEVEFSVEALCQPYRLFWSPPC
jgi:uncharacterized phiE125 gp8 family phage protein